MGLDIDQHYDKIYKYCYFRLQNRDLAEDITQETFLRFFASETYRDTGQALQYLYTVARNLCVDEFRRPRNEELPDNLSLDYEEGIVTSIDMRTALNRLSEEERELILLRYINEVPLSVMGKLYGMSRFALYRRIQSITKKLQGYMGEE